MQKLQANPGQIRPKSSKHPVIRNLAVLAGALILAVFSVFAAHSFESRTEQFSSAFDPLSWAYPAALQATLRAFGEGVEHFSNGQFAAALSALPDRAAASTVIPDLIIYYKARAYLELNRTKEALDLFRFLQDRYRDSPMYSKAILGECRSLVKLGDPSAALAILSSGRLDEDADVLCLRAQALEAANKRAEAISVYLRIYAQEMDSSSSELAEKRLRALAPGFLSKPENREFLLQRGGNMVRAGKNREAKAMLLRLDSPRAAAAHAGRLYLLIAEANINMKRFSDALVYLRRVSDSALAAQANYLEAVCYRGLRNEAAFRERGNRARLQFPDSPFTEKLLYAIATYYELDNRMESARETYAVLAAAFPRGDYAERALWKLALFSYAGKRYDEALRGFYQCLLVNPTPAAADAPIYWMGRCCEQMGSSERASYFYRRALELANNGYYGQRAKEALAGLKSMDPGQPDSTALFDFARVHGQLDSIRPEPLAFPQPSASAVSRIERARQLAAAGLFDLAISDLSPGCGENGSKEKVLCFAIARIHQSKGNLLSAISALRRAFPDYVDLPPASLPDEFWEVFFPVRHLNVVTQNANGHNLAADLILALIRQESAFQPSARSKANARGLMQVLPSTGRTLAAQTGLKKYNASKLYQPETNITLGTHYLASLLQRYGGRVELALAAYNAGYSRVDRWLLEFGDVDMAEFVERIPFSETRGYVKQVLSSRAHYQLRTVRHSGTSTASKSQGPDLPRLPGRQ